MPTRKKSATAVKKKEVEKTTKKEREVEEQEEKEETMKEVEVEVEVDEQNDDVAGTKNDNKQTTTGILRGTKLSDLEKLKQKGKDRNRGVKFPQEKEKMVKVKTFKKEQKPGAGGPAQKQVGGAATKKKRFDLSEMYDALVTVERDRPLAPDEEEFQYEVSTCLLLSSSLLS